MSRTGLSDVTDSDLTASEPSETTGFVSSSLTGPAEIAAVSDWLVTALGDPPRSEVSFFGTL